MTELKWKKECNAYYIWTLPKSRVKEREAMQGHFVVVNRNGENN